MEYPPAKIDAVAPVETTACGMTCTDAAASHAMAEPRAQEGRELLEKMRRDAVILLLERIARKELITEDEFRKKLGVNRKWAAEALNANRLFSMQTPSGETVYPAFYGDPTYERQALEQVCKKLGNLSGSAKYDFFTRKSLCLDILTPLEALRKGMLTKVLVIAGRLPSAWQPVSQGPDSGQSAVGS